MEIDHISELTVWNLYSLFLLYVQVEDYQSKSRVTSSKKKSTNDF